MDPVALIFLVLCIVLVGAMWAALASAGQVAQRVRVDEPHDDGAAS